MLRRELAEEPPAADDVPSGEVIEILDEAYEGRPGARLDVYVPRVAAKVGASLPTVVWFHGGAWVGGDKRSRAPYLRRIAAAGFTTVGVNYSLAPETHYPAPILEGMAALRHLVAHAERLHVDSGGFVLAGETAGAQIGAQLAAMVTNRDYAAQVGVEPSLAPEQLRAVALCSGIFDLEPSDGSPELRDFLAAAGRAYSGFHLHRREAEFLSAVTVARHLGEHFPPTLLMVGNADLLSSQSPAFAAALSAHGVPVETMFFDGKLEESRSALARLVVFLERHTEAAG